jgi:hypothetical protein
LCRLSQQKRMTQKAGRAIPFILKTFPNVNHIAKCGFGRSYFCRKFEVVDILKKVVDISQDVVDKIKNPLIYLEKWSIYFTFRQ